jgi:hypothetical protein
MHLLTMRNIKQLNVELLEKDYNRLIAYKEATGRLSKAEAGRNLILVGLENFEKEIKKRKGD